MKSKKARRIRLFQDLQKNSPPKRKAYFVLKFVLLDIFSKNTTYFTLPHLLSEAPANTPYWLLSYHPEFFSL